MTLRVALAKSRNIPSVRILETITPAFAQQWITRFGFDAVKHPPYLTMALGAGSVTPMQMADWLCHRLPDTGYRDQPLADHQNHRPARHCAGAVSATPAVCTKAASSTSATPSS